MFYLNIGWTVSKLWILSLSKYGSNAEDAEYVGPTWLLLDAAVSLPKGMSASCVCVCLCVCVCVCVFVCVCVCGFGINGSPKLKL